jgi:hypothetical protein
MVDRFCGWGHDTDVVGRYNGRRGEGTGTCKECHSRTRKERRAQLQREARVTTPRDKFDGQIGQWAYDMRRHGGKLPASRLRVGRTAREAGWAWTARWGTSVETGRRAGDRLWSASRITVDCADRWCVALGTSLAAVYPEVYYMPRNAADISLIPDEETVDA